jgi:outer membrane receptor protein involved in Fe transport
VELPGSTVVRGTWFDNRMKDPISTKVLNGNVNTLQRANLGRTRVWGFQTDVETHLLMNTVTISGSYLYNDAKITENPLDTTQVGKILQQVPKNRGSIQVAYTNPRFIDAALSLQMIGRQFDDVTNVATLPFETTPGLPAYATLDLTLKRTLSRNFDVFFGVQNLTDQTYYVQTGPSTTGAPRLVTGGFRVRFSGR